MAPFLMRRVLRGSSSPSFSSSLLQLRSPFATNWQFSGSPPGDDTGGGGGDLPPSTTANLFVGGLSYDTNESVLKDAFAQHGEIVEVKVICDRVSGKSKGFGFVKFSMESEATTALKKMDGQLLDDRYIRVDYAKKG